MNSLQGGEFMKYPDYSGKLSVGDTVSNNLTEVNRIGSGGSSANSGVVRDTALRSSLPGEYVSLLLLCHSLLGVAFWILHLPQNPAGAIMVIAGLWIAFRAVGGFAGEKWAAGISVVLFLMTGILSITGVSKVPPWLSGSLVAPVVWTCMLGVLLVVDFFDCRRHLRAKLSPSEKRKQDARHLKLAFAGLFLAWGLGIPIVAWIHQISHPPAGRMAMEKMSFIEHAGFRCGEALVTACFFALGCNIGSFLNVVVWRMPMGRSIVNGDSCCPNCNTRIAARDNIPLFGWLSLGGQCRTCSTEISSRYPVVEAITGSIFLLLYFVELISGGANLPVRPINHYRGVLWIIMYAKWDLIGLYLYHCFLFASLLVFTLMAIDSNRIPRKLLVFCFVIGIAAPLLFPSLVLIPAIPRGTWPTNAATQTLLHSVAGAICGMIAGAFICRLFNRDPHAFSQRSAIIASLTLIGTMLGWQAMLSVTVIFFGISLIRKYGLKSYTHSPWHSTVSELLFAALLHHLFWRMEWTAICLF